MSRSGGDKESSNVKVICRVRPENAKEKALNVPLAVRIQSPCIDVTTDDGSNSFTFDHVFGAESTQAEVFELVAKPGASFNR